ncbi:HET-domain-containing protein [Xylaria sp. FL0043]|nr:HET-domain-containing protein [Xylaria sp. FL0043]
MGCGPCFHQASAPGDPELTVPGRAPEPTVTLIAPGAIFYFDANPAASMNKCSLCAVVRGSYLEHLRTDLYWIHHPPKTTREETTTPHLLKLEVRDITSALPDARWCDLLIAKVMLQDTWYVDEVEREFYFHSNHSRGVCGLERHPLEDPIPDYTEYGALLPWADLQLARAWIRECDTQHTNCQPIISGASVELHPSTRFIDAKLRRLVVRNEIARMPVEFVALSYVWGTAYQLRTTSATVGQFRERLPSSTVTGGEERMPKTIEDAMEVTLALGYRYLWVDALCIIQDSPADLQIQLVQMNHIYGLAAVTIVARSSRSSDSGLPGVSTPRDWLGGENLTCKLSCGLQIGPWDVLDRDYEKYEEMDGILADTSCYMWRGWTFQEQILSTRTLEFNHRRLVFWCGHSEPSVECGAAPIPEMRDPHHFRSSVRKYIETGGLVPPGEQVWDNMTRDMLISRWNTIRENFVTRHFTFLSDRRNALLGTASMLRHVLGDVDSSGHVLSQIGRELLWHRTLHPGWNSAQAPAVKLSYNPAPPGMYPSWSWLSLWPLSWPSDYKPFTGTDVQLKDTGGISILEIRGPSLEMSVVNRRSADKKGAAVLSYEDGTDSRFEVCLDRSLETTIVVTCAPIASTIHSGSRMYAWCYGMLLLRDIGGERFERVGAAFANESSDFASEFLQRIQSDQARRRTLLCV